MNKLLSIVVPTKDRYIYLKPLIELIESFNNPDLEIVVQDNSVDNSEFISYIEEHQFKSLVYHHKKESVSVSDNSDMAILNSSGKYVCFLGDDDLLSPLFYRFVQYMDKYGYESAIFQVAKYYWPGTKFAAHSFPNLVIRSFKPQIKFIDVKNELELSLKHGMTTLGKMPKVYHGVVLRTCLDKIYERTGSFFPGSSPDMANSVALSEIVTKHIYCDVPFISSGTSPKSTAGLGATHNHAGDLKDISFLPDGIEEHWNNNIPKVWTGPTIYAQSAIESWIAMGISENANRLNFNYNYAYFVSTNPSYKSYFKQFRKNCRKYNFFLYYSSIISIFLLRTKEYLKNVRMLKFKKGAITFNDINDTIEAERVIDKEIKSININDLFSSSI